MPKYILFLKQISKPRIIGFFVVFQAFFLFLFHGNFSFSIGEIEKLTGYGILDSRFNYTAQEAWNYFEAYGEEGRALYRQLQWVDFFYPLCYTGLLLSLIYLLYEKSSKLLLISLLPIVAMFFDYAENTALFYVNTHFPNVDRLVLEWASWFTGIKFSALAFSIFLILGKFFQKIGIKISSKIQSK